MRRSSVRKKQKCKDKKIIKRLRAEETQGEMQKKKKNEVMKGNCRGEQRRCEGRTASKPMDRDHDERTDNRVLGMLCEESRRRRRRRGAECLFGLCIEIQYG